MVQMRQFRFRVFECFLPVPHLKGFTQLCAGGGPKFSPNDGQNVSVKDVIEKLIAGSEVSDSLPFASSDYV